MKYARLALAALGAALVGLVLVTTQPAAGQVTTGHLVQVPYGTPQNVPVNKEQWFSHFVGGQTEDPELQKLFGEEGNLDHETARLVEEYSRTEDEAQRGKTRTKLAETLQKQFDLQQRRRELEVARIEAQLKKLREIMRKRGESRQTIIDRRLDQLVREAEGLGWTSPHGATGLRNFYNGPLPQPSQLQRK